MNIVLSRYTNEKNAIEKTVTTVVTLTGDLKSECDIINPVLLIEIPTGEQNNLVYNCNYAYIADFGRYYFITGIKGRSKDIIEISMHVDVLYSWKTQILSQSCVVARQEKAENSCLHISDSYIRTFNTPYHLTKEFPTGFTTQKFLLAVAGSST